jgi:hypothetical protein
VVDREPDDDTAVEPTPTDPPKVDDDTDPSPPARPDPGRDRAGPAAARDGGAPASEAAPAALAPDHAE